MTPKKDRIYLEHILECAERIRDYTAEGKVEFINNPLIQDAVLRRLQTMAESTQRLSDEIKSASADVDWRSLSGFRNVLVHDYLGGIDIGRVWNAVEDYLPELESTVRELLED